MKDLDKQQRFSSGAPVLNVLETGVSHEKHNCSEQIDKGVKSSHFSPFSDSRELSQLVH